MKKRRVLENYLNALLVVRVGYTGGYGTGPSYTATKAVSPVQTEDGNDAVKMALSGYCISGCEEYFAVKLL